MGEVERRRGARSKSAAPRTPQIAAINSPSAVAAPALQTVRRSLVDHTPCPRGWRLVYYSGRYPSSSCLSPVRGFVDFVFIRPRLYLVEGGSFQRVPIRLLAAGRPRTEWAVGNVRLRSNMIVAGDWRICGRSAFRMLYRLRGGGPFRP